MFAWLRPNDLVWNYWVNNYLLGNDPPAFDILAWNTDSTNLPGALHAQFLDIFEHNMLSHARRADACSTQPVDLGSITCDTYVTGATTDHLTPWQGCYRTTQLRRRRQHVRAQQRRPHREPGQPARQPQGPDCSSAPSPARIRTHGWRQATEQPGTWWEHWADWMIDRAGEQIRAPAKLGSRKHKASEPAPGRYVHAS